LASASQYGRIMTTTVAFLVSRFPNRSETFIEAQVEGLLERGFQVEIVALALGEWRWLARKWGERLRAYDVRLAKTLPARIGAALEARKSEARGALDAKRFGYEALSLRLAAAAARWPRLPEARRVWLAHYGRWGALACSLRELGVLAGPIATVFHGKDMSAYLRRRPDAYRRLFAQGDLFLPISQHWRETLLAMGAPETRVIVHRMGVDAGRFQFRARARSPGEPVRFLGVGRLVEKKGFDDAIAAFGLARQDPSFPMSSLTIVGEGALGPQLRAQARALKPDVRFTGALAHIDVAAALAAAHVFVLPSKTARNGDMEGVPVALMEAMAMGLPVLSTRHSGIAELVAHEVSGLLCEEADVRGLAENMAAIARAPERWAAMGEAGAARVHAEFDLGAWNDRLAAHMTWLAAQQW